MFRLPSHDDRAKLILLAPSIHRHSRALRHGIPQNGLNHGLTVYHLEGFERQDTLLDRSITALYDSDNQAGAFEGHGEAEFILRHVQ